MTEAFCDALRDARGRSGKTQQEVAAGTAGVYEGQMTVGLSRGAVSHFESGLHTPSVASIELLTRSLGVEFRCSEHGWSTGPVGEADGLRAGLAIAVDLLEELQHAWEIGQGYHQEEDPQRCPDPVCDGYIGLGADLEGEHEDDCRYVQLRALAGLEG